MRASANVRNGVGFSEEGGVLNSSAGYLLCILTFPRPIGVFLFCVHKHKKNSHPANDCSAPFKLVVHDLNAGGGKPQLFVILTDDAFNKVRTGFGEARHFGRSMPRELPKSWSYLQQGWNTCARTPVTRAIEMAVNGDAKSVTFNLFSNGLKQKKKGCKICLELPEGFDEQVHKVAALVDYFALCHNQKGKNTLEVKYKPSTQELDHITEVLKKILADPATSGLSMSEICSKYIATDESLGAYRGTEWDQWFLEELNRISQQPTPPLLSLSVGTGEPIDKDVVQRQELKNHGVLNAEMIRFIGDLSRLVHDDNRSLVLLVDQWRKALKMCSSQWSPPPLWWCLGSMLVGDTSIGMTRKEGDVFIPATCLENWDIYMLLKLLNSDVFPEAVRDAARNVKNTRTDIAHERFDCDWHRDWSCMADLLNAMDCPSAAAELREFCEAKTFPSVGGETC